LRIVGARSASFDVQLHIRESISPRHCGWWSLRDNGSRECAPEQAPRSNPRLRAPRYGLLRFDCNDDVE
jgi:hypothetical protein